MAITFTRIDTDRPDIVALRLCGTVSGGDHLQFTDAVADFATDDTTALVLDLRDLGSVSEDLAGEFAACQRRFVDNDAEMVFVSPNVVISWYLDRRFGPLPRRTFPDVDSAVEALSPDAPPAGPPLTAEEEAFERILEPDLPEWSRDVNEVGRPDRLSLDVVHRALRNNADPSTWLEPLRVILRRVGLGSGLNLCRRDGSAMQLVGREEYRFSAEGWFGSLLVSADCPLCLSEIVGEGLTLHERAFLKWCDADVVVPLLDDAGKLQGALFVHSARDGGLYTYRSGELLSLALLGRLLGRYLVDPAPVTSAASGRPAASRSALDVPELLNI